MSVKINSYKGRSIRPVYKVRIKKDEYSNAIDRICNRYKLGHIKQNESGREYKNRMNKMFSDDVIQSMKKYSHHGRTSLFGHSVHVSYYNYLVCKKLHLDEKAGAKAGLYMTCFCTTGTSIRLGRVRDFMVLSILQRHLRMQESILI